MHLRAPRPRATRARAAPRARRCARGSRPRRRRGGGGGARAASSRRRRGRRRSSRCRGRARAPPRRSRGRGGRAPRSRGGSRPSLPNHQSNGARSPAQPCRKMHSTPGIAASTVSRSGADVVGVPEDVVPPTVIGCTAKLTTAASGLAVGAVDADHRDRVVDRPLALRRGCPESPGARPTAEPIRAGSSRRQRRVDRAGELVAEQLGVALERGDVGQAADGRAAREARRAVVVARVHRDRARAGCR